MAITDDLWGGKLKEVRFDPTTHRCELVASTLSDGQSHSHILACSDVSELRFHNAIPEPWTYAEITEVHVTTDDRTGDHLIELVLWSEDSELTLRCGAYQLRDVLE